MAQSIYTALVDIAGLQHTVVAAAMYRVEVASRSEKRIGSHFGDYFPSRAGF